MTNFNDLTDAQLNKLLRMIICENREELSAEEMACQALNRLCDLAILAEMTEYRTLPRSDRLAPDAAYNKLCRLADVQLKEWWQPRLNRSRAS